MKLGCSPWKLNYSTVTTVPHFDDYTQAHALYFPVELTIQYREDTAGPLGTLGYPRHI